jgi:hypothetical protein
MPKVFQQSETWVAIGAALGQTLVAAGVVEQEAWNNLLYPAIVYITGRVTSKVVKK